MAGLIALDGGVGEGGGQILRAALTLACVTGQGFEMRQIRERRPRPGLRPQHLACVRAAAMACDARVSGALEGSRDLRFEPGTLQSGEFRFDIETAGATGLVLQTVLPALARAGQPSVVEVTGGTHVPKSPSVSYLARHWSPALAAAGFAAAIRLVRAGFYPRGGGEARGEVGPLERPAPLVLESRGRLQAVRGVSGAGKLKGDVARRLQQAAQDRLWEERRLEAEWEVGDVPAASPGSFLQMEAVFEGGRLAVTALGQKGLRAELVGDRAARRLLALMAGEGAVDPQLADQLAVPMAVAGGGRVSTGLVTSHLQAVARVLTAFSLSARVFGRPGGPGGLEVTRC